MVDIKDFAQTLIQKEVREAIRQEIARQLAKPGTGFRQELEKQVAEALTEEGYEVVHDPATVSQTH